MNKLNNNGWGIESMITFLVLFIFFLLLIAFLVYSIDHDKNSNVQLVETSIISFDL